VAFAPLSHLLLRRHLSAYLDGEVPPGLRRRLEGHLSRCSACRRELAGLEDVARAVASLPRQPPPRSFALTPATASRPSRGPTLGLRLLPAAAALCASLLAALVAYDVVGPSVPEGGPNAPASAPREALKGAPEAPSPLRPSGPGVAEAPASPPPEAMPQRPPSAEREARGGGLSPMRVAQLAAGAAMAAAVGGWAILALARRRT